MTILRNPTDAEISNYRIEEVELGADGKAIVGPDGGYKRTGVTLEWSIKPGETLEFPDYVAKYLKHIYDFLEVVDTPADMPAAKTAEANPDMGNIVCKHCGLNFKNYKALALHMAGKHPEKL